MTFRTTMMAALGLALLPAAANALVVGSADSTNCYPFLCNDSGAPYGQSFHYQQIYDGALFGGPVSFDTITFFTYAGGPGEVLNGNYVISFSTTTDPVGTPYEITNLANTASFYSGNLGGTIGYSFSVAGSTYAFDPANGNLLLDILVFDQDNVPNGEGNTYLYADYTGIQTSRAVFNGQYVFNGGGALVTEFNTRSLVPEPASWALMIGGFGLVGMALRRRVAAAA